MRKLLIDWKKSNLCKQHFVSESSLFKTAPSFFFSISMAHFQSFQYLIYTFSEFQICHAFPRVLFCVPSWKRRKWWSEKSCAYVEKKFWNVKTVVLKGQLYDGTSWGGHLHFWRLLFQHLVFNSSLSGTWPHSRKLSSHVIISTVLWQVWFEILLEKVRKKEDTSLKPSFAGTGMNHIFLFLSSFLVLCMNWDFYHGQMIQRVCASLLLVGRILIFASKMLYLI